MNWLSKIFRPAKPKHPEHEYSVADTGSEIIVTHHGTEVSRMAWIEILDISIITNDEGPWLADVFWKFRSANSELIYPQMALGEKIVSERAFSLTGFDTQTFLSAMSSTENQTFVVWKKNETEPNKAMQTTPVAVTTRAIARVAPSTSVSDL